VIPFVKAIQLLKQLVRAGGVRVHRDGHVGAAANFSRALVASIPAVVPLAF
jgi:hypothetical protein